MVAGTYFVSALLLLATFNWSLIKIIASANWFCINVIFGRQLRRDVKSADEKEAG